MGRILAVLFPLLVFALGYSQDTNCYEKLFEFKDLIKLIETEGSELQKSALNFFRTLAKNQQSNFSVDGASPDDRKLIEDIGIFGPEWKDQADINFRILLEFFMFKINLDDYKGLEDVLIEIKTMINSNEELQKLQDNF